MNKCALPFLLLLLGLTGSPDGAAADPAELIYRGGYGALGDMLGVAGLDSGDVAGDGGVDILVTGTLNAPSAPSRFSLLRSDPQAALGYRQVAFSPNFDETLRAARLLDLDGDGVKEIVVGLDDGSIQVFRGHELQRLSTASVNGSVLQIELADADGDGALDLVVLSSQEISLFDPLTLQARGSVAHGAVGYYLNELAIGNVDAEPSPEVVLNTGAVLRLKRNNGTLESELLWQYPAGRFGIRIGLADIDGDGMQELIAASDWDYLTTFDLDIPAPKWQIHSLDDLDAMTLADVNGDGVPEAVLGKGQWGNVFAIDLITRQTLWTVDNPEHGVGRILVADIDGDGERELLWAAGDSLFVHDLADFTQKWRSLHDDGPFNALALQPESGGNSIRRVAFASLRSNRGDDDGFIHQWNSTTLQPLTLSGPNTFGRFVITGIHALAYTRGTPQSLLVGTDRLYDGAIYTMDVDTSEVTNAVVYDRGSPIVALTLADADGDGQDEIVAANQVAHSGSPGVYVYLIDPTTGAELWRSISLAGPYSGVSSLVVADLDGDSRDDIIATGGVGNTGGFLFQFTGVNHTQWQSNETDYTAATTHDIDSGGRAEVMAGTTDGVVRILDGISHGVLRTLEVGQGPITALRAFRDPQSNRLRVASMVDEQLRVHDVATGELLAVAPHPIRGSRALEVADAEGRGRRIDFFVGDEAAFRVYCMESDPPGEPWIFSDGLEAPACSGPASLR